MISTNQAQDLLANGATVVGQDDEKIGKVGQLYLDDATGEANWVTVKTGMFGSSETFVPLDGATVEGGDTIRVPYTKDLVKDAPNLDVDQHLSVQEEERLYAHYGLSYGAPAVTDPAPGVTDPAPGVTAAAGTTDRAAGAPVDDASVVRHEEDVDISTRRREAGKVRLRKYVVTDHVTKTVPVQREEVRVEREPVTGGTDTGRIGEDEATVTLHEDEVVVDKETRPVERVSVGTETVTEQQTVGADVRKEEVDVDTDVDIDRDKNKKRR